MLLSELQERERRFRLALRAGIPVLVLFSLVFYTTVLREEPFDLNTKIIVIFAALLFVTVYFIFFLIDVAAEENLTDQTTHGFTAKSFVARLRRFRPKAMALLVIDNLATINEHHGSDKVDAMLYDMVHRLNDFLQKEGFPRTLIARRYGAEFLIAFDNDSVDIERALHMFCRLHRQIDDIELDLVFSLLNRLGNDIQTDLRALKDLLYIQSKRNPLADHDVDIKDARKVASIEEAITHALETKALHLTFRPIKDARTDRIAIYEVSVKLRDLDNQPIPPKIFLPIINRMGLGSRYDRILFGRLIDLLPLLPDDIALSFNISPFSLRNASFQEHLFSLLDTQTIDTRRLIIELYERKAHHDLGNYLQILETFRSRGFRIAVDNFGASNASMEYMKHFRFDFIQFDREYVTRLNDASSKAMLGSMILMAKELGIKTIAKWVDKTEQKRELIALGIDYLQGFGIGKPIDEETLIRHHNS